MECKGHLSLEVAAAAISDGQINNIFVQICYSGWEA